MGPLDELAHAREGRARRHRRPPTRRSRGRARRGR
jgi:hypothetical protein